MNIKNLIFYFLFFISHAVISQNSSDWQPIYLTVSGHNQVEGIEAFFKSVKCNNEDAISVRFINHNNHTVKLEWYNEIFTNELKWISKKKLSDIKTITITPNSDLEGDCLNGKYPSLIIRLSDFGINSTNFKRYAAYDLKISLVKGNE